MAALEGSLHLGERAAAPSALRIAVDRWNCTREVRARVVAALLILGCALWHSSGHGEELPLMHFTPEHQLLPLPSASVQNAVQDSLGFVWLGFYSSGLARYDGHSLELFGRADGLPGPIVREVAEDAQGYLWVGCDTGLVVSERPLSTYLPGDRIRFLSAVGEVRIVQTRIRHQYLAVDPRAGVWVGTAGQGLYHYRFEAENLLREEKISVDSAAPGSTPSVSAIATCRDGTVWIALTDGALAFIVPDSRELVFLNPEDRPSSPVAALHEGPTGILWAGCWDGRVVRLEREPGPSFRPVSSVLQERVSSILETADGELWVATLGAGLLRLHMATAGTEQHFTRREGLLSETIWQIRTDREGNLWICHNAGFSRLRANYRAFGHFTGASRSGVRPVLPEPTVFSVLVPERGVASDYTWAGTGGGLVAIDRNGESMTVSVEDGLSSNSVYTIGQDADNRLWVGTLSGLDILSFEGPPPVPLGPADRRVVEIAGRKAQLLSMDLGIVHSAKSFPLRISEDGPETVDSVWVSIPSGVAYGVICYAKGAWYIFGAASGLPASGVINAAMDPDGRLWVCGKENGVVRSRRSITVRGLEEMLGSGRGLNGREITESVFAPVWGHEGAATTNSANNAVWAGGRMWVGTNAGLIALHGDPVNETMRVDGDQGLGGDTVHGMAVSPVSGTLWVTQNEGLAEVDPSTGHVIRVVSKWDGLVGKEAWTSSVLAVDASGTVYFATPEGLAIYRAIHDLSNAMPPLLRMRSVDRRGQQSGHNEVAFHYAALSFSDEQRVRYRTRLLGYENDWSAVTTETKIRYTNLPAFLFPRRYTFAVTAANDAGLWATDPLLYEFRVHPAWWLTWWAAIGYAAVLAVVVYALIAYRTTRLMRRTLVLEEVVDERTARIRSHVEELETLDQIVEAINRDVVLEKVMEACLEQGLVLLPHARKGAFVSLNRDRELFEVVAEIGWGDKVAKGIEFTVDEAMERYFAEPLGHGLFIVRDPQNRPGADKVTHLGVPGPLLSIDLTVGGDVLGFLVFDFVSGHDSLTAFDLQRLRRYRRHAINALDKARVVSELEHASTAKSSFLAAMSHELRTPLNSIIGFSSVLLKKMQEEDAPSRYRGFQSNVLNSAQHLLSLINDILDLSKVEAGKMELELEEVSVTAIVASVCRIMQGVASQRRIELIQDLPDEGLPAVIADPAKLKQVLFNLVSNAVKFSPDSTAVTISAAALEVSASSLGIASIEIAVQDQGIGIGDEDKSRVFEEFRQLNTGPYDAVAGSGLGLALVKRYVALHGGQVSVDSTLGEGSIFRILIPTDASPFLDSQPV